ncbi:MAG TPA: hypothetical protein VNQ50_06265 [Xanthobacteraceae bacterium]|nr:hypothetical protein [Xanthobacteraceae bacterium]
MSSMAYSGHSIRGGMPAAVSPRQGFWARLWAIVVAARQQQALEHIRRFGVVDPQLVEQAQQTMRAGAADRARDL